METNSALKPLVFLDADVLFAGAASPSEHGASLVVWHLAEITLIKALTCRQVIVEVERNLAVKLPGSLPAFRMLTSRCLRVVPDVSPSVRERYMGMADPKDVAILAAAHQAGCPWLISFNTRHYLPGHPDLSVLPPGAFIRRVRHLLSQLC